MLISHLDVSSNHLNDVFTEASNYCNESIIDYIKNKYPNYTWDITNAVIASIRRNKHDLLKRF